MTTCPCTCQLVSEPVETPMGVVVNFVTKVCCDVCRDKADDVMVLRDARVEKALLEELQGYVEDTVAATLLAVEVRRIADAQRDLTLQGDWLDRGGLRRLGYATQHAAITRETLFPNASKVLNRHTSED